MRKIVAIAWKDALVRFASRSELLFFLVLPIVFTFLIGGGLGGSQPDDPRLPVRVVDEDASDLSAQLLAALAGSATVQASAVDRATAEAQLADEAVSAWVLIPAGFAEGLRAGTPVALDVHTRLNDPNGTAIELALNAAASQVARPLSVARASVAEAERRQPFSSDTERAAYFEASLSAAQAQFAEAPARVAVTRPASAPAGSGFNMAAQASAGQLITWVFIPLLGTSALFAYERRQGTLRRLLTTPSRKLTFLLGTLSGQLALAAVQMLLLVVFGVYVMGLNWGSSPAGLAVMLLSFALAAVALGTMLGTFIKTESQGNGLSIMLGMVMALLGGCWYPSEFFPEIAQTAARVLPTAWAMQGLTDLVMRGQGLSAVLPEAAVLTGFAVVFMAVGVWRFRFE
jgi:ABC-2 type transport system permease protein